MRRAAAGTGKARRSWGTHRAISPTCQDPEVVDLAVQLQPAGNREGEEGRGTEGVTGSCRGSLPTLHSCHVDVSLPTATAAHRLDQPSIRKH